MESPTLKSNANYPLAGEWMHTQRSNAAAVMRIGGFSMENLTLRNTANCPPAGEWKRHNVILPKGTKPFLQRECTQYTYVYSFV